MQSGLPYIYKNKEQIPEINPFKDAVAYYAFEDTTGDLIDLVNSHHGVLSGGITRGVSGKVGNSYLFNGINGKGELPISIYNHFDNNNFTTGLWFKTNNASNIQMLVSDFHIDPSQRKIFAFINNNKLFVSVGDNGTQYVIDNVGTINSNQWYFFMLKYDVNGKAQFYLDDVLQSEHTFINPPINQNPIWIGEIQGANSFPLNGQIDEMFFINGQTTREIDSLIYNSGNGTTINNQEPMLYNNVIYDAANNIATIDEANANSASTFLYQRIAFSETYAVGDSFRAEVVYAGATDALRFYISQIPASQEVENNATFNPVAASNVATAIYNFNNVVAFNPYSIVLNDSQQDAIPNAIWFFQGDGLNIQFGYNDGSGDVVLRTWSNSYVHSEARIIISTDSIIGTTPWVKYLKFKYL